MIRFARGAARHLGPADRGLSISRSSGLLIAGALAAGITCVMAWPVLRMPTQMVYGHEIVGRHPDIHAMIATIAAPTAPASAQALTDLPGWLLARAISPVAAFNVLVLMTFPLTALATYALARYLYDSHAAALAAALVFSFSPAHLAQAAYHPYVAQTQWLPLYLLATVALVDRVTIGRVAGLALAWGALVFSNTSAVVVASLLAPVVLGAFWIIRPDADRNLWPLVWPGALLAGLTATGIALVLMQRPADEAARAALAGPIGDIGLYRAHWWAYFTPAVDHPLLGGLATSIFDRRGVNLELLEEQLYTGYAFVVLALVALVTAAWTWRPEWRHLVALAAVALAAGAISVGPMSGSCEPFSLAPACLAFQVVPTLRAYARFGLVVNLVVALAAGTGAVMLARRSRFGQSLAALLLVLGAFEFWPLPARAHDVLPTAAHRWLANEPVGGRILDCYPENRADTHLAWLMKRPLAHLDSAIPTCADPELGATLAASGFSHVLVRGGRAASQLLTPLPSGIDLAKTFSDSRVFTISATPPSVVTASATGFFAYEHDGGDWWRWMGPKGEWRVRNTTAAPKPVTLAVDLVPYGVPRTLSVTLDGAPAGTVRLGMTRSQHVLGPWTLAPGDHVLAFSTDGEPARPADVADSRDNRPLSVAFRNPRWSDAP